MQADERVAVLEEKVERLSEEIDGLRSDVRELVVAWQAAGAMVAIVKTAAAIVLSIGVIIGAFKFGISPVEPPK